MSEPKLSKSQYIKGKQCPKALWFYRHRKDLAPEIDDQKQAMFDTGNEVGELAKEYFGGGPEINTPFWDIAAGIRETNRLISAGNKILFEATAIHPRDGSYARIDVLRQSEDGAWDLIEVKSATSVKDYHVNDMSFQYHVFSAAGYRIRRCLMMVINNEYIRQGDLDVSQLFRLEDISDLVFAKQGEVQELAAQLGCVLNQKREPDIRPEARCFAPFECDYKSHCWKAIPEYSVFNILSKSKAEAVARRYGYEIENLPPEALPEGRKRIDIQSYLNGEVHCDRGQIEVFLDSLQYPLYYLDYETFSGAVPFLNGTKPYQQIPFQFSLHIQQEPDGELMHFEFIHKERTDPRRDFTENLISLCGNSGSVIAYNAAFEKRCNRELAACYPEYAEGLAEINKRMVDLLIPFRNRWLYHPDQKSSASIKYVLPAFTDISYADLEIGDGGNASYQYSQFMAGKLESCASEALWDNLSTYCKQDTYAMKVLLDVLILNRDKG